MQSIEGVDQIKRFKDYTKNFTELEKLTPDEILYLNLCEWLHPKSLEINAKIKEMGLKITEVKDGITCVTDIHEFDIFHSLLGEMRPGSVADTTSGGHWLCAELKAATFDIDKIEKFGNGFLDIWVKPSRGNSASFKPKTFFPAGNSIEECSNMIVNAIKNPKKIINITETHHKNQSLFLVLDKLDQTFAVRVTGNKIKFFPSKTSI